MQSSSTFGERAVRFYKTAKLPCGLDSEVQPIYPYRHEQVFDCASHFFGSFFGDNRPRVFVFGINPGRFGSGMTGIPFTDPVALEIKCGIVNNLEKRRELSSEFIYRFIEEWGGPKTFYKEFFITAVSPIGFIKNGVNFNYYDDIDLLESLQPFLVKSLKRQINCGARRDVAIVLGRGKNKKIFEKLNEENGFFKKVYAVDHPRYIMQYQRKNIAKYVKEYKKIFSEAIGKR